MKSILNVFIFILLAAGGTYYVYDTNQDFKESADAFIQSYKQGIDVDSIATQLSALSDTVASKSKKKKIPKVVKSDKFSALDKYARETPKKYDVDIATLAQYLIKPAKTDIEKVRVLFTWVATHISYDDNGFNSGNFSDCAAEKVLQNKRAVCEGYSNLLKALCDAAGFEAEKVLGYAKGYGYEAGDKFKDTDHAWNVIKVDNKWRLFDVTWASGSGENKNGELVSTLKFNPYWFDVPPKAFVFSHLPELSKWQLTGSSLTLAQYEVLPDLDNAIFELGFNPDVIYQAALLGKEFADAYAPELPIDASKLPYVKSISRTNEFVFQIQSDYAEEIALIDGDEWHYFSKKKNTFTLSHKPVNNKISISVKINWYDKNFSTIIMYQVTEEKTGLL